MKIEINQEQEKPTPTYPYLKICKSTGTIVLFVKRDMGTCIYDNPNSISKTGDFIDAWNEDDFEFFNGTITLSND